MDGKKNPLQLSARNLRKLPLRYGTDACHLTLTDDRFTEEIVRLRNTQSLGRFIHFAELTAEDHRRWLAEQLKRDDALNFTLVAKKRFAGTVSLYNIEPGRQCELGRVIMPDDGRRIFALVMVTLAVSFAFDILGMGTIYCVVNETNNSALNAQIRSGWKIDPRYARTETVNGRPELLTGLSLERTAWPACEEKLRPLTRKLLQPIS